MVCDTCDRLTHIYIYCGKKTAVDFGHGAVQFSFPLPLIIFTVLKKAVIVQSPVHLTVRVVHEDCGIVYTHHARSWTSSTVLFTNGIMENLIRCNVEYEISDFLAPLVISQLGKPHLHRALILGDFVQFTK